MHSECRCDTGNISPLSNFKFYLSTYTHHRAVMPRHCPCSSCKLPIVAPGVDAASGYCKLNKRPPSERSLWRLGVGGPICDRIPVFWRRITREGLARRSLPSFSIHGTAVRSTPLPHLHSTAFCRAAHAAPVRGLQISATDTCSCILRGMLDHSKAVPTLRVSSQLLDQAADAQRSSLANRRIVTNRSGCRGDPRPKSNFRQDDRASRYHVSERTWLA
jgi:hypothetical protein